MSIVMEVGEVVTSGRVAAPLARRTTTLYDLITALQAVVGPKDDALVVATVVHLLRSGRLSVLGTASTQGRMRPWSHS